MPVTSSGRSLPRGRGKKRKKGKLFACSSAQANSEADRPVEAVAEYQEAIKLAPTQPGLHEELGSEVSLNGQTPEGAIAQVIRLRARARSEKNFAESDRLRDALLRCGVELRDEQGGDTTWQAV